MIPHSKDVFLIHTKGDDGQRLLAEELIGRLSPHGVEVWAYDDWRWKRPQSGTTFKRHGLQVDPVRFLLRDPKPFVHAGTTPQVDTDALRRMLRASAVVVLLEPRTESPSAGVEIEKTILEDLMERPSSFDSGVPVLLRFPWEAHDSRTFAALPISMQHVLPGFQDRVPADVVADVASIIYAAFLVQGFHSTAGLYLLLLASDDNALIRKLTENVQAEKRLDFRILAAQGQEAERRLRSATATPGAAWRLREDSRIRLAMAEMSLQLFEDWWRHAARNARSCVGSLATRTEISMALEAFVAFVDARWTDAWRKFLYSEE